MNKFVTYNSSAGSGKTYTLVKEYLKIALGTDNQHAYRNILAVTFTNKAAAEMKERVISALQSLSGLVKLEGTPMFLMKDLILPVKEGGLGISREEISTRSEHVLSSILHNYNDFGISTIDKFTHKIVRTFAHDLHLPLNFEIEIDETEALSKSIDLLISEVGVNEQLTKLLLEYTKKRADDEQSWHIEKELFNFSKNLLKDDGEIYLEKIRALKIEDFESIKKQLHVQTKKFEDQVKTFGENALQIIQNKGVGLNSFSRSFFPNYWKDLLFLKKFQPTATTVKIINGEQNWYAAKVDAAQKQIIDVNKDLFIELYQESRTFIDQFEKEYIVDKLLVKNLYNLAVINEIEKTIIDFKKENNVLNISDFNKRISAIVASEPIPFIYERVGEKYNHYLIDEFQDTSIVQWHNLIPLVDNSLASDHFNMIVGDAKQAIYRFRGGEVEQIINLPAIYKNDNNPILLERESALKRNHKNETLSNNFRSKAEIVGFNNLFFQSVAVKLSVKYQPLYQNLTQAFDANNRGGGVSIRFLEANDKEEFSMLNFNGILETIQHNIDDNYQLGDIAILTRSNTDGAAVAAHLIENGINVISSESLLLVNSEEVQFVLDLFKYMTQPADKNYQLRVLNYLIQKKYPKDDLFNVFTRYPKNTLSQYLEEKDKRILAQFITSLSLYELSEYLINYFDLDETVDVYLQFFLDKVYEYAARNDNSVINFLEWWEAKSYQFSIVVPDGVDAVRVMSIHKSKGLEFPVVIYPFATSEVKLSEKFFWTTDTSVDALKSAILPINKDIKETDFASVYQDELDKSVLDLINLMYVAFTRPKERLFILSEKNKKPKLNGAVSDYLYSFCEDKTSNRIAENHFVFGDFCKKELLLRTDKKDQVFDTVVYNNWRERIKVSYQAPQVWDVENPQKIGEHGTLVHKILSEIVYIEDIPTVLNKFLLKGVINEEELKAIQKDLEVVFKIEGVQSLFTTYDEVKNEASILLPTGESYQPDRVVLRKDETIIVDYKTGEQELSHSKQIQNYKARLTEMGYQNLSCYLLYLKDRVLVKV